MSFFTAAGNWSYLNELMCLKIGYKGAFQMAGGTLDSITLNGALR